MKIAVPTRNNEVDSHFGHCESYTIYDINENKEMTGSESLPSPQGCGCKSNIASVLQEKGVTIMLAGNMGRGALNVLNNHGIDVCRGCSGDTEQLVKLFLTGKISDSGEQCHAHEEGHVCNHD
jgi:predicted Fe-Mo cluster-binding NifX family protein